MSAGLCEDLEIAAADVKAKPPAEGDGRGIVSRRLKVAARWTWIAQVGEADDEDEVSDTPEYMYGLEKSARQRETSRVNQASPKVSGEEGQRSDSGRV